MLGSRVGIHKINFELLFSLFWIGDLISKAGNTKGGSITVPLTSCFTGFESAV
jgi:hypothetical protein